MALSTGGTSFICAILADASVKCWGSEEDCNPSGSCMPVALQGPELGASLDVTATTDRNVYGAWRSVDLGTRP